MFDCVLFFLFVKQKSKGEVTNPVTEVVRALLQDHLSQNLEHPYPTALHLHLPDGLSLNYRICFHRLMRCCRRDWLVRTIGNQSVSHAYL